MSLSLRSRTQNRNGCIYIKIPADICKRYDIKGSEDEYIDYIIHRIQVGSKVLEVQHVMTSS